MVEKNSLFFVLAIVIQLTIGGAVLFLGSHSVYYLLDMWNENKNYVAKNKELDREINELSTTIELLSLNFTKEKFAREKLHMARKADIVYTIS